MDGVFQAPEGGHAGRPAVMFGGTDGTDVLPDTWLFTGWTWDNESFQPLAGTNSLDSSLASRFAVFSPNGGGEEGGHGWEEVVEPIVSPSARCGAAMANRVLFGGNTGLLGTSGLVGDTWFFRDGPNASWLPLTEGGPSPRRGHSMVWDIDCNVIVLFGGQTGDDMFSDETWELDLGD